MTRLEVCLFICIVAVVASFVPIGLHLHDLATQHRPVGHRSAPIMLESTNRVRALTAGVTPGVTPGADRKPQDAYSATSRESTSTPDSGSPRHHREVYPGLPMAGESLTASAAILGHAEAGKYPGLCSQAEAVAPHSPRSRYLSGFVRVHAAETALYVDPAVEEAPVFAVTSFLGRAPEAAKQFLGVGAPLPPVYLHGSPELMRRYACVAKTAIAYYDGAIHLSVTPTNTYEELARSLKHEYVHHILFAHNIFKPIWFHEGAAMLFAREPGWRTWRFQDPPMALDQMAEPLRVGARPETVEAFYGQAYAMVMLLQTLCVRPIGCRDQKYLIDALHVGTTPANLFEWATTGLAGDMGRSPIRLLEEYVANGYRLTPPFLEELMRLQAEPLEFLHR